MSNIETAIEEMIQTYIDEQDYVTGMTAEMYTDGEINDLRADMEGELGELQSRIEALEAKIAPAAEDESEEPLDAWLGPKYKEEPRAVNQIDWIMTTHGLIAGYDSKAMLESYVRSVLPADQSHQAEMLIAMVLTTARNLINKKLEAES
jgi:BMFP domain-containing protein YqiC